MSKEDMWLVHAAPGPCTQIIWLQSLDDELLGLSTSLDFNVKSVGQGRDSVRFPQLVT